MSGAIDPNTQREFNCSHCNGRIVIPINLPPTSAPCPHCQRITTSPAPTDRGPSSLRSPAMPVHAPSPVQQDPRAYHPQPVPQQPVEPLVTPQERPVSYQGQRAAEPSLERERALDERQSRLDDGSRIESGKRSWVPAVVILIVLLALVSGGALFLLNQNKAGTAEKTIHPQQTATKSVEEEYLRSGWEKDAYRVLDGYLRARTGKEKAAYLLGGPGMAAKLVDFYGSNDIDESNTPLEAFSIGDSSMEDRKRGMFMLFYEQPPQFEMREFFRPLATLEVQYGIESADMLLSSVAQASNFALEPVKIFAFFKQTSSGLKLEWDLFAQTKYRTFRDFVAMAHPGRKAVFRVFILENVAENGRSQPGVRTYLVADPAYQESDTVRIDVKVDSEVGRALSPLNWRGVEGGRVVTRTATVELEWTDTDTPELFINRLVCWEFLGLGGEDIKTSSVR